MSDRPANPSLHRKAPLRNKVRRASLLGLTLGVTLVCVGATHVADSRVTESRVIESRGAKSTVADVRVAEARGAKARGQARRAERSMMSGDAEAKPQTAELLNVVTVAEDSAPVVLASYSPVAMARETRAAVARPDVVWMEVTAYCACTHCCGPNAVGLTASGKDVGYNDSRFVAADTDVLPFGTRVSIPGYAESQAVEVIDRGGAIKGNRLDVFFPSHEDALQWGRQWVAVTVTR